MFRYSNDELRENAELLLQHIKSSYQVVPKMMNPKPDWDNHLLMEAIRGGYSYSGCFNYLISEGVDVNKPYDGSSPLMQAASLGLESFAGILLDQGADIDWKDFRGMPAILIAALERRFEMVKFLLERGADPSIKGQNGINLIRQCVVSPQHLRMVLERFPYPNEEDGFGNTPIHDATISRLSEAIDILVEFGANVNHKDRDGRTPLMYAVRNGSQDTRIVQQLFHAGADVQLQDERKLSALHFAKTKELIDILVEKGASVNAVDINGSTALHHRVRERVPYLPAIQRLLDAGAEVNAKDNDGNTPLHYLDSVKESGLGPLIKDLLSKGARS
ncbi:ankyrin repeat-containing domain protein [Trichoderma afarasin]